MIALFYAISSSSAFFWVWRPPASFGRRMSLWVTSGSGFANELCFRSFSASFCTFYLNFTNQHWEYQHLHSPSQMHSLVIWMPSSLVALSCSGEKETFLFSSASKTSTTWLVGGQGGLQRTRFFTCKYLDYYAEIRKSVEYSGGKLCGRTGEHELLHRLALLAAFWGRWGKSFWNYRFFL